MRVTADAGVLLHEPTDCRERVRGLLGRGSLSAGEGLLLRRCRSVHTVGMRFPIDVVLLDAADRAVRILTVPPGRLVLPRPGVRHVLEAPAGHGRRFAEALRSLGPGDHP